MTSLLVVTTGAPTTNRHMATKRNRHSKGAHSVIEIIVILVVLYLLFHHHHYRRRRRHGLSVWASIPGPFGNDTRHHQRTG